MAVLRNILRLPVYINSTVYDSSSSIMACSTKALTVGPLKNILCVFPIDIRFISLN